MATLSYPGVYVEEVPSGVRPIAAASTSIPAFIGVAEKGPLNKAVKVFNFTEYQNLYGGFLDGSFLSHAVFQFFNNGGTQCYIVRVSGANTRTASIVLNDRGTTAQQSLTISAISPGVWGNKLAVVIANGTNDPGNEFNLSVYWQDELTPLEKLENLSMVPGAPNFVETIVASSKYIRVTVNQANTNVQAGTSRGAAAPSVPLPAGRSRFRINIDGDGYQEVNLQDAVGSGTGQVADLDTAANVAGAIQFVVRQLTKLRASTNQNAFTNFQCTVDAGVLLLTSGAAGLSSSANVAPASNSGQDASGLLNLGKLEGGQEILGAAVTRPRNNPAGTPPGNYYLVGDHAAPTAEVSSVQAGSDGDPITTDQPYTDAFSILDDKEDVSLIAVPGIGSKDVVGAGMNYCANRPLSDCFFIGDMAQDDDTIEEAKTFRDAITPKNSYGAIYLPWLRMLDPTGKSPEPILVPPSGYVAGLYAKTDAQRGVWKAPAGTAAALGGAVGVAVNFTDVQQGNLNPFNINVIRQFAASGIVLWGARTITSDPEWNYIPVRRMAIFLRVSIYRGIQWAVFEPNDEDLWAGLRLNIGSFMMTLFRQGAFQGSTPSQAFFVKCDSETTTQDDINLGIVNILVGFAPLKPAEFVVVKISQKAGQPS
ncbi:MAG: phage tail sheath subtilisin-like domain-containing protein [Candidatus Brocadia sinica]|nr:phage tail sheath subtilisin-like domain-containing protein [Candidatus Brocadia sinica]NUO05716.1 phage tail sheath subtilisin-like domain-containing protein [Candidatus Brocadia sinica]